MSDGVLTRPQDTAAFYCRSRFGGLKPLVSKRYAPETTRLDEFASSIGNASSLNIEADPAKLGLAGHYVTAIETGGETLYFVERCPHTPVRAFLLWLPAGGTPTVNLEWSSTGRAAWSFWNSNIPQATPPVTGYASGILEIPPVSFIGGQPKPEWGIPLLVSNPASAVQESMGRLRDLALKTFPAAKISSLTYSDPEENWQRPTLQVLTGVENVDARMALEEIFYADVIQHESLTEALRKVTVLFK